MMPPPNRVIKRPKSRITKAAKKSNIDIALEAVRAELKRDYPLYEEALLGVLRAKAAGGSATPWSVIPPKRSLESRRILEAVGG